MALIYLKDNICDIMFLVISLEKRFVVNAKKETKSKIFYDLFVNNQKVGEAWIRKKDTNLRGMYIEIFKGKRNNGFGSKFMQMLESELANMEVWGYLAKVNKKNIPAVKMIENVTSKYADKFVVGNRIIYSITLIVE